jgi:hypothetical protein
LEEGLIMPMTGGAFAHFIQQVTSGTHGPTSGSGTQQTININTEVSNTITGCSLATNQITLPAGTYYWFSRHSVYKLSGFKFWLWNDTDSVTTIHGMPAYNDAALGGDGSHIQGIFTITGEKVFEVHAYSDDAETGGWGRAVTSAIAETYAVVYIEQLKNT